MNAKSKKWRDANPDKYRAVQRRHRYGCEPDQYATMLVAQGGVCRICGGTQEKPLYVDHDHVTGKIRGLLCQMCNQLLGAAKDKVETLERAVAYLKEHSNG